MKNVFRRTVGIAADPYLESLFGGVVFPDGTMAVDHIDDLIECQKIFMKVVSEIREVNMFTYALCFRELLHDPDGKKKLIEAAAKRSFGLITGVVRPFYESFPQKA